MLNLIKDNREIIMFSIGYIVLLGMTVVVSLSAAGKL